MPGSCAGASGGCGCVAAGTMLLCPWVWRVTGPRGPAPFAARSVHPPDERDGTERGAPARGLVSLLARGANKSCPQRATWWSARAPVLMCQGLRAVLLCCNKTVVLLSFSVAGKPDSLFSSTDTDQGRDIDSFHVQSVLNCEGFFFPPIYFQLPAPN